MALDPAMAPDLPLLAQRTLARLIEAFAPERVILFGSYAKGTADERSDVDLLVVANVEDGYERHMRRARQLSCDSFPAVDVVLVTPGELSEAGTARSPFLLSILGSGVTLYERMP